MRLALLLLLLAPIVLASPADAQTTTRWVDGGRDYARTIGGYAVESFRNAGDGGLDWTLVGSGEAGGWGTNHLWLLSGPVSARTALTVPSAAVAFMMDGDGNDGFATFLVNGESVGTFDLYGRGVATLVVEGLPIQRHVLEVRYEGTKRPEASATHIAFWGGSALVADASADQ